MSWGRLGAWIQGALSLSFSPSHSLLLSLFLSHAHAHAHVLTHTHVPRPFPHGSSSVGEGCPLIFRGRPEKDLTPWQLEDPSVCGSSYAKAPPSPIPLSPYLTGAPPLGSRPREYCPEWGLPTIPLLPPNHPHCWYLGVSPTFHCPIHSAGPQPQPY